MALTRRDFADKLRTMNRSGSKAPLQNVQLPTNQSRYQTPSMKSVSPGTADKQAQMQANSQALAATGGLLGKIGKGAWDAFNRSESMALDKASSANLGKIGGMMSLLQGSNVDAATNMAGDVAGKIADLPQPSMLGNGIPTVGDWSNAADTVDKLDGVSKLGDLSSVNDAVTNATQAAEAATTATDLANASSYTFPGAGAVIGAGLNAAQGNWGQLGAGAAGAAIGSAIPGVGTGAGWFLGNLAGRWL